MSIKKYYLLFWYTWFNFKENDIFREHDKWEYLLSFYRTKRNAFIGNNVWNKHKSSEMHDMKTMTTHEESFKNTV